MYLNVLHYKVCYSFKLSDRTIELCSKQYTSQYVLHCSNWLCLYLGEQSGLRIFEDATASKVIRASCWWSRIVCLFLCMDFEPPWTGGKVYLTRLCMVDAGRERYHYEISGSGWSISRDNFWADHEFGEHVKIPVRQCTLIYFILFLLLLQSMNF